MKLAIRFTLFGVGMLLALLALNGCLIDLGSGVTPTPGNELSVAVSPLSGYYPLNVTITISGVTEGQYSVIVEGHTYAQGSNILCVTIRHLPCEGEVIWERPGYATQRAQFYIALDNKGPVIGMIRFNGLDDLWYLHPRYRYIVDAPDAYDPEGGPVTLVDAHVQVARKTEEDTVFCPPFVGVSPPKPDVYHAFDRNRRTIENAFVFHCTWTGPTDEAYNVHPSWKVTRIYYQGDLVNWNWNAYECKKDNVLGIEPGVASNWKSKWIDRGSVGYGTSLPFSPPGYGESGYPGNGTNCAIAWPTGSASASMTTITETWRDQDGAETTESWVIPTGPDPGCNIY